MLDPTFVRDHLDHVRAGLAARGMDASRELDTLAALDQRRRQMIPQVEGLKREQNASGEAVARAKKAGEDVSHIFEANKQRGQTIKGLEAELETIEHERQAILDILPNLPHASVPVGRSAADNVEVRAWGERRVFDFTPKAHWDSGPELGIIDFERATRVSGSRFAFLMGDGAKLERALINFMLDADNSLANQAFVGYQPALEALTADSLVAAGAIPESLISALVTPASFAAGKRLVSLTPEVDALWLDAWSRFTTG